jgi:hypothetical protein
MTKFVATFLLWLVCGGLIAGCSQPADAGYPPGTRVKVGGCYPGVVREPNRLRPGEYVVAWLDGMGQYHERSVPAEMIVIEAEKSE